MLNSDKVTELFPEVGEDTEAIPDTRTENDDLLLSHVIDDDPPKDRKFPILDMWLRMWKRSWISGRRLDRCTV